MEVLGRLGGRGVAADAAVIGGDVVAALPDICADTADPAEHGGGAGAVGH